MELITQDDARLLDDGRRRFTSRMMAMTGSDGHDMHLASAWVCDSYSQGVEAILETGRRLACIQTAFRDRKTPGGTLWGRFIGDNGREPEGGLPFKKSQVQNLIKAWVSFGPPALVAISRGEVPQSTGVLSHEPPVPLTQLPANTDALVGLGSIKAKAPERFEEMVADGTVHPGLKSKEVAEETRQQRKERDEQRITSIRPVQGKFRTVVFDPPWEDIGGPDSAGFLGRAAPDYATMNQGQLIAMAPQVRAWLEPEAHVYLWTINNRIEDALELAREWGLDCKAFVTWCKPVMGLGASFRNATEHFLFCTTGGLAVRANDVPTWFVAPPSRGQHSAKPREFYDIVRRMSYGPYGECFQRSGEPDFANTFEEAANPFAV